ncbi:spore coat protein I [Oxobacter pfennigii]|uniref:Spore coat protein I n=1 Tax=Oxobacter pfennigii TaxID=36849 RepID=A0A0P8W7B5_9CLOT|nr:hypothetical protein [Oxobacter pfennigii]KPU44555.1 spore coat protein I [Oxobacter pfennigii]
MKLLQYEEEDFLNGLTALIENEYNLEVKKIDVMNCGNYVLTSKKEKIHVLNLDCTESHLIFINGIYDYTREKGFKKTNKIYATAKGKKYISFKNRFYMLSAFIEDDYQGNFPLEGNEIKFIKTMAEFHKCSMGYSPPQGGRYKCDWGKWMEKYKKQYRCLKRYREQLENKTGRSDFEENYIKYSPMFLEKMDKAIKILKQSSYIDIVEKSMISRQIVLGSFKLSNFYIKNSDVYLKTLNKCRYDIVERDIADFLEKIAEYDYKKGIKLIKSLIKEYEDKNCLDSNSINIIKAFLIFPQEIEKVCSRFYKGKDKWSEELYLKKLLYAIDLEDRKSKIADALSFQSFS